MREHYDIIHSLLALNGERAIAILECTVNNSELVEREKTRLFNDLEEIKTLSESTKFIYEYQPANNSYIQALMIVAFMLIILAIILAPIGVFVALVIKIIEGVKYLANKKKRQ
jgi:hypothetical protein